jgi:hypothetical protein
VSPARATPVIVHLPDAGGLAARVDRADDHSLTLVLCVPPEGLVKADLAVVEYATPTGIHRIAGGLAHADDDDPSVLRLDREDEEVLQRRSWARVDAIIPVDVVFRDEDSRMTGTVTLNVSGGGALIRDPVGLPIGASIGLEIHIDGEPIHAGGRVVRAVSDAKGIELDPISSGDRERIVRFVTARQRADLAMRVARRRIAS